MLPKANHAEDRKRVKKKAAKRAFLAFTSKRLTARLESNVTECTFTFSLELVEAA